MLSAARMPSIGLGDHDRLLRDVDGEHELAAALGDGLVEDGDVVHVGALVAEVAGVAEERRVAVEAVGDLDVADARVRLEELERPLLADVGLGRGDHVDDVAVRGRHVHEQAGGLDVRHDRHEVEGLVVRHGLDLGHVDEAAVRVAGVGDAAHDGDDDALHADLAVEAVDGADEAGGVAARQLEVVLADALLVVGVAVEEDVDDVVLLAALEDRLDALGLVELLVLAADAAGRGVEHDVDLAEEVVHGAGDGDAELVEGGLLAGLDDVQVVGHARPRSRARVESVGATSTTPTSSMSPCRATPSARRWPMTP